MKQTKAQKLTVIIQKVEVDEIESYVGQKIYQKWPWHRIEHQTGTNARFCVGKKTSSNVFQVEKATSIIWNQQILRRQTKDIRASS
ncbi:hypothetical protein [Pleurocapsa sp. FMAR1]|uniref:hypothetical protein n=1 Tax=Pleurocapsa sp. FMAR1 TaxID=3040204 RepID=UPI0029C6FDF9|nr:hypothetical protein [Pleurocapsa sp. FMAR1]